MQLEDFIKTTLVQISSGINQANLELKDAESRPRVNPREMKFATEDMQNRPYAIVTGNHILPVHLVDFDVALHATEGTETGGGIAVAVGVVGLGTRGKSEASTQSESRVHFSIPMIFPSSSAHS